MGRWLRGAVRGLAALLGLLGGTWAALVLLNGGSDAGALRRGLALGMALLAVAAAGSLLAGRGRRVALPALGAALAAVLVWFASLEPSNARVWQPDVAQTPWAEIEGSRVTLHNVRHFEWRTESDFTPRWETRQVDLDDLKGVDLIASYWMGDAIAHVMVSFVFDHALPLTVSIETRKEAGEAYSALLGFFHRYELVYVVSDERDLIGVRTNVRTDPPEDVYLYRTNAPLENVRRLFLEYLRQMNSLHEQPVFYDTATTNCTTVAMINTRVNGSVSLLNWKILLSGYLPQLAYERGRLDRHLPFEELRRVSRINDAARAAGLEAPDFSRRIREGLPVP
jgi:hypothetical protein